LFPWLSAIATRFETYRFNSLRFIYEPQTGTDAQGTVMLAVDFDAVDPAPLDKLQIMTYDGAVRSPPWFAAVYECAAYNLHKYKEYYITRDLTTPTSTDEKTYFVGNIFVATQSLSAAYTSGELYVEYDITLSTPQMDAITADQSFVLALHQRQGDPPPPSVVWSGGSLNVLFEVVDPFNTEQDFIIVEPGCYVVTLSVRNAAQSPDPSITTTGPPAGFDTASIYQIGNTGNAVTGNFSMSCAVVTCLTGSVWFEVDFGVTDPSAADVDFEIFIAPFDQETLAVIGPLSTPPTLLLESKMKRYLQRMALRHKVRAQVEEARKAPVLSLPWRETKTMCEPVKVENNVPILPYEPKPRINRGLTRAC
jgi:hypothetical protein